jgi:hypothetical protein
VHRRGNGFTMARADEAFRVESRATVFFGVVTSKSEPLTFHDFPQIFQESEGNNSVSAFLLLPHYCT